MADPGAEGGPTLRVIRAAILVILVIGLAGTTVELLLLRHTEGFWQVLPVGLAVAATALTVWIALAPRAAILFAFRAAMIAMILAGGIGVIQHYRGNVEWELERMPGISGMELFRHSMMGATPALAPGMLLHFGLLGLAYAYRHPAGRRERSTEET